MTEPAHEITGIRTHMLRLPLRGALRWGAGSELLELEHVLVSLETAGGVRVLSEAPIRPTIYGETVASVREVVERVLAIRLVGRDLFEPALVSLIDVMPFNFAARSALDTAVWLARSAASGSTLAEDVAATRDGARVSFILGIDAPAAMVREAERIVAAGVRVLKVKVGRDEKADDAVLTALRHSLSGEGVTIYADANEAYSPGRALARLEALADRGVAYVEEPLPVRLIRARAELRKASPLPIIADDSCFGPGDLERELDFDTFDILNVKPARSGVSASLAMMERAAAAGKGVMIGSQAASGLGTVHAAALALRPEVDHPCELAFPLKLERDSLERPLVYRDGWLSVAELEAARPAGALADESRVDAAGVNMAVDFRRKPHE